MIRGRPRSPRICAEQHGRQIPQSFYAADARLKHGGEKLRGMYWLIFLHFYFSLLCMLTLGASLYLTWLVWPHSPHGSGPSGNPEQAARSLGAGGGDADAAGAGSLQGPGWEG